MKELIEKFKALDTKQKIIVGLAGMAIITFVFALFAPSSDESLDNSEMQSFETPEDRNEVEDYNSKLDAYNSERKESEDKVSLDFNIDDFKEDNDGNLEEEMMEREIDSLMNENKREYSNGSSRGRPNGETSNTYSRKTNPVRVSREPKKEDVNAQFESFFSTSPKNNQSNRDINSTDPFIYAAIHGDHTIKQGERVKLRLTKKATIAGMEFSQNSYIYAFPSFQSNRILLDINSINHVPVSISAYDTEDSALGLYVKGAKMVGEITDESTRDAVDEVDVGGIPIGATVKKVFQKKQQVPTVTLLNNTKLILKPNKS